MSTGQLGCTWLKEHYNLGHRLTHQSYLGGRLKTDIQPNGDIIDTYTHRYQPRENNPLAHLEFTLKYDDLQLPFLSDVLKNIPVGDIIQFIENNPGSIYSRKIGYLYEFLTNTKLPVPDRQRINYVDLLDSEKYFTGKTIKNNRWFINDNLLGSRSFCPIVRKTKQLFDILKEDFQAQLISLSKEYPPDIFNRANSYLYKKETRSSFQIENEVPTPQRVEKFLALLTQAGKSDINLLLTENTLTKCQNAIVDRRFAASGFRDFQNYIGQSSCNYDEIIHYICPPPQLVNSLMQGLNDLAQKSVGTHPVVRASIISFGFVFVHPFEDGNGRIHRFLIHDILSRDHLVPDGMIIPVSAHMVNNMKKYDETLEEFSKPLVTITKYFRKGNNELEINNPEEIEKYYRYPDLTYQSHYLAWAILETITKDIVEELIFLQNYDDAKKMIQEIADIPDKLIDLFIKITHQNKGIFPNRKRKHFDKLTDNEIQLFQKVYSEVFA